MGMPGWSSLRTFPWLVTVLTLPLAAQETWTVDAAGGADFTSVGAAVASAGPGDLVLVATGTYDAFLLDKTLTILGSGPFAPQILARSTVQAPGGATLAHLAFERLELLDCAGKVLLDDVRVEDGPGPHCTTFRVADCADVQLQGCVVRGKHGDIWCGSSGLLIERSTVELVDGHLRGGDGWRDALHGFDGRVGIEILGESRVLLALTTVEGGDGGTPYDAIDGTGGHGAAAISIGWGSTCVVRGNTGSPLLGGAGGLGAFPGEAASAAVSGFGTLVVSGVSADPPVFGALLALDQPALAQPFLRFAGGSSAGETAQLDLHGPAGAFVWLALAWQPADLSLPAKIDGTIRLDLGAALPFVPLTTAGQELAQSLLLTIPTTPVLLGLTTIVQGFAQGLGDSGQWLATNAGHVVVR